MESVPPSWIGSWNGHWPFMGNLLKNPPHIPVFLTNLSVPVLENLLGICGMIRIHGAYEFRGRKRNGEVQQKPRISKTEPGKLWGQQNRICSYYSLIKPEILYTFEVLWCFFLFLHLWLHYPSPYPLMYHWPSFAQCQPSANPTCCGLGCGTKRASHSGSAGFLRAPKIRGPSDPKKSLRKPAVQQTLTLTVSWSSCHRWLHGISGCFLWRMVIISHPTTCLMNIVMI